MMMNKIIKPVREKLPETIKPYFYRWQSNNSPNDLGIIRFIFDIYHLSLSSGYGTPIRDFNPKYGVPPWAKEALAEYFVYTPNMTKEDRSYVYATYREGAKTFYFTFVLPIYEILVGQYGIYYKDNRIFRVDYHVLKAKSSIEAQKRLMSISSFLNRPIIKDLFGDLKPTYREQKSKDAKDTNTLLVLSNGNILQASGIDQPIRGANILQVRPKSIIFDDPQNRENVKTPERRAQTDKEVMEEAFGALASKGSIIYIGNKVHADDTLGKLLKPTNKRWKKQFHTLTYALDENGNKIPGVGNLDNEYSEWPERYSMEVIRKRKEWYESQPELGGLRSFLKEYYNIIISDQEYNIRYHNAKYVRKFNRNWLMFDSYNGQKIYKHCLIVVSNDPAISQKKESSDAVISVVAKTPDNKRYLLEYVDGKFDIHDRYFNESERKVLAVDSDDMAKIRRYGNVEWVARFVVKYKPDAVVIEVYGQQLTFYNEVKELLDRIGYTHVPIIPSRGKKDNKVETLRQLPLVFFEKGDYYIKEDMKKLESEIISFPHTKLDILDSLYLAEEYLLYNKPDNIIYNPLGLYDVNENKLKKKNAVSGEYEPWIVY